MYSVVRVPNSLASTRDFEVLVTSIRWNCECSGDDRESETAESCPGETRQGATKIPPPSASCMLGYVYSLVFLLVLA